MENQSVMLRKMTFNLMEILEKPGGLDHSRAVAAESNSIETARTVEEVKKPDMSVIPNDFHCPLSLELMRDPVIVSSCQVYFDNITLSYFA